MNKTLLLLPALFALLSCSPNKEYKTYGSIKKFDNALDSVIAPGAKVEIIADSFDWAEGPVWVDTSRMLLFSDVPANTIYKWTEDKGKQPYLKPSGYTQSTPRGGEVGSNGLAVDNQNELILCQQGDRRIAVMMANIDTPHASFKTIAAYYHNKRFNSPNDLVLRDDGSLFFTDPPYGLERNMDDSLKELPFQGLYRVSHAGEVTLLTDSLTRPNGIAFMPGQKTLLVGNSDSDKPFIYAYDIDPSDSLVNPRIFCNGNTLPSKEKGGFDGMKVDDNGNVFASGPGGIWILDKNGKPLGLIQLPGRSSNCALTPDGKTLFITADMYVLRVKMKD